MCSSDLLELPCALGKHQPRHVVGVRVLLPIAEMIGGLYLLAVGNDPCAAMRRRTQANDLRPEMDRAVVSIVRDVVKRDVDSHSSQKKSKGSGDTSTWSNRCARRVIVASFGFCCGTGCAVEGGSQIREHECANSFAANATIRRGQSQITALVDKAIKPALAYFKRGF